MQPNFEKVYPVLYKGWDQASAQADFNAGGWQNKAGADQFKTAQTPAVQPQTPVNPQPQATPQPSGGGSPSFDQVYGTLYPGWDRNSAYQDYVAGGWKNKAGAENFSGGSGGVSGIASTFTTQPTLDLASLYETAYKDSGLADIQTKADTKQAEIDKRKREESEAEAKINENPYYSEATRVGKINKLREKANADISNLISEKQTFLDQITSKKADIETKLNINLKQFDINSTTTQNALSQFNTLLSMGTLNNASSEDIANIAKATGLSSSMIQSAINSTLNAIEPEIITETDDAGNVTYALLNKNTGEIVKKQSLGKIGKADNSGGGTDMDLLLNMLLGGSMTGGGAQTNEPTYSPEIWNSFGNESKADQDTWNSFGGTPTFTSGKKVNINKNMRGLRFENL